MPKKPPLLTDRALQSLQRKPGLHPVGGDAPGLYLRVKPTARSWVFRVLIDGKQRDMGLGSYPLVTLANARTKAAEFYIQARAGVDPIADRQAKRTLAKVDAMTFRDAVERYIEINSHDWKGAKEIAQWRGQMENHVYPGIGLKRIADITKGDVVAVFQPLWTAKMATAKRLHLRVDQVLKWTIGQGYRAGPSPAAIDGLRGALGKLRADESAKNHAALPFGEIAAFVADLNTRPAMSARALEFLILTAARTGEVRHATWREIDLEGKLWTIPGARMKGGKDHDVPLSDRALAILQSIPQGLSEAPVFPSETNNGKPMSDGAMGRLLERMGHHDITVHGFRSTFRDWAGETTSHAREVIEHALAHNLPDRTERAYARGSLLEKRRKLMAGWAAYCG